MGTTPSTRAIYHRWRFAGVALALLALPAVCFAVPLGVTSETGDPPTLTPSVPHYATELSYTEFAVVHEAVQGASDSEPKAGELRVRLGDSSDPSPWHLEFDGEPLMDLVMKGLGERIARLKAEIVPDTNRSQSLALAIAVAESARNKMTIARGAPQFTLVTLEGRLSRTGSSWRLSTGRSQPVLRVEPSLDAPEALDGRNVIVTGISRAADTLEALQLIERCPNTVDLFVMSLCPFARHAESALLTRIAAQQGSRPTVRVHYILYPDPESERGEFRSMHGDDEVKENLVQIVLRDEYPRAFLDYLALRAMSDADWPVLAHRCGLNARSVLEIATRISADRQSLLRSEYAAVARGCGIRDGSPTILWEGRPLTDARNVPWFDGLNAGADRCAGTP